MSSRPYFPERRSVAASGGALHGAREEAWKKYVEIGLIALLVFSPLPQGSAWEWSVLVIKLAVLAMALAYVFFGRGAVEGPLKASLRVPRILICCFFGLVLLQAVPLPSGLVKLLSPASYAFHGAYAPGGAEAPFLTISLAPATTVWKGLTLLAYVLAGFLLLRVMDRFRKMERLAAVVVGLGAFQALYGLFELSREEPRLLFYKKLINLDSVTGTFVNRNHLAGYLEMIIPLALGLLIARIGFFSPATRGARGDLGEIFSQFSRKSVALNIGLIAAAAVMAVAVVKSQSRAGVFLVIFTFLLLLEMILFHLTYSGEGRRLARNLLTVSFLIVLLFSLAAGMSAVMDRFYADDTVFKDGRTLFWENIFPMVGDYPVFGTGLGTFASAYPVYDRTGGEMRLTHAHNDYLELMSETGILGFLLLAGAVFWILVRSFRAWRARRNLEVKGLGMGGLVSCVVMLIHSFTDFNLHIP
ncbi:MAG: hypothetical protein FJY83_07935, partial [Candidatus Aminicenantes bacterium]|nr:hypothetical protein [Candidatus Aminicenantes bacterium]